MGWIQNNGEGSIGAENTLLDLSKRSGEPASEAVVRTVAEAADVDEVDLPPLYSAIDPDCLNTLFERSELNVARKTPTVGFEYHDYYVTVHGDEIKVHPNRDP